MEIISNFQQIFLLNIETTLGKRLAFIFFNFVEFPFLMLDEWTKKGSLSFFLFGIPLILVCYCYFILYYRYIPISGRIFFHFFFKHRIFFLN